MSDAGDIETASDWDDFAGNEPVEEETPQEGYEPEEDEGEGYEELSTHDVVDFFMGQPDEEERAEREQIEAQEALADGSAVRAIAEEQAELSELAHDLVAKCPGIDSDEFIELAKPIMAGIGEEYELETVADELSLVAQVYEELGGAERWAPDLEAEEWAKATFVPSGNVFVS